MVNRTLEDMTIEFLTDCNGKEKVYKGYVNKSFYHYGYAPYFEKEVALQIMEDNNNFCKKEKYNAVISYDEIQDIFIFENKELNTIKIWKCEEVQTEHGTKKLYSIGIEWQWDILETE